MTELMDADEVDRALKAKHRAMWAPGDYPALAREIIPALGPILVRASRVRAGMRVLDVAAGAGNAAIPAALVGADVVASDLTSELFEPGRRQARAVGAAVEWIEGDAEALPFADGEFDAVLSCVGVMFAPHHQVAADELVRVCRPGGTIALLSWTPEGFVGQLFACMKPYAPPPPPGAQPAPLPIDQFATPEAFRDYFKSHYGPTIAVYRAIAADPDKVAALDRDLADLARSHGQGTGLMGWEYLLLTARLRR